MADMNAKQNVAYATMTTSATANDGIMAALQGIPIHKYYHDRGKPTET